MIKDWRNGTTMDRIMICLFWFGAICIIIGYTMKILDAYIR